MADRDLMLDVARKLHALADSLQAAFGPPKDTPLEKAEGRRQNAPEVSLVQVRTVLAEKSRDGYTAQVRQLLQKYGAEKLSDVDAQHYIALMKDAEVLGNAT